MQYATQANTSKTGCLWRTGGSDTGAEANVRRLAELLRAQIRCVRLLQAAGPSADHALEYAHACRALSDMVQQGAVAARAPPQATQAYGAYGAPEKVLTPRIT